MRSATVALAGLLLLTAFPAFAWALLAAGEDPKPSALEETAMYALVLAAATTSLAALLVTLGSGRRAWPLLAAAAGLYAGAFVVPVASAG